MKTWLSGSLHRYYPASAPVERPVLLLEAARGEQVAFQAVVHNDKTGRQEVTAAVETPDGMAAQVRRVGYVPMPHLNTDVPPEEIDGRGSLPGYVPDPLFPETTTVLGPLETQSFWITLCAAEDMPPGEYMVTVVLTFGEASARLTALVILHAAVLQRRQNFPVTHWFYADALMDRYKVDMATDGFWRILDPYLADVAAHGQDTVYVPVFTPPLDGVKRPTQLLHVSKADGKYRFDWTQVRRWIRAAQAQGIDHFEWTHFFTQWGVNNAIRIYEGHGETETLLWPAETGATSDTYRAFLAQYLPELERFLQEEHLLERSFFHVSDEPGFQHLENYRAARELLRELAPWLRVMDALSNINFAREGLTDTPIPSISETPEFIREGFPAWTYFCCGPRGHYLNRLQDTPLQKIRMSGWLFYRTKARGFLHWGYNYWYKSQTRQMIDPFITTDGLGWPGWAHGDPFVVYPGADGPIDSLRWEVFAESLQDYALLQAAGIDPDAPLLDDIRDYQYFPRDQAWIWRRRTQVLRMLDKMS